MERLTENKLGQSYPLKDKASSKVSLFTDYDGFYAYFEAVNRLGCIEDILGADYDLDRLRELVEADKAGRCVVLPLDIGDSVFDDGLGKINEWEVIGFSIGDCSSDLDFNRDDPYNGELVVHTKNEALRAKLEFPVSVIGSHVFHDYDAIKAAIEKMKEE